MVLWVDINCGSMFLKPPNEKFITRPAKTIMPPKIKYFFTINYLKVTLKYIPHANATLKFNKGRLVDDVIEPIYLHKCRNGDIKI